MRMMKLPLTISESCRYQLPFRFSISTIISHGSCGTKMVPVVVARSYIGDIFTDSSRTHHRSSSLVNNSYTLPFEGAKQDIWF
ncbi:unnamed protein product [Calypogeia fissa]